MIVTAVTIKVRGKFRKARMIIKIERLLEELRDVADFRSLYNARLENKMNTVQGVHHTQRTIKKREGVLFIQRTEHPPTRANMRDIALCKMFLKERIEKNTNKVTFWAFLHKERHFKSIEFLLFFLKNIKAEMLINQNQTAN